ncbi:hypothetical protein AB0N89_19865 [Amycolatopsis sp. NPDC089917]|uniref:hypothetical protein n=1 Tax=Amycolatopsis sp. NPDC089917 TaxID=3155187 RepID=UPI003417BBBF
MTAGEVTTHPAPQVSAVAAPAWVSAEASVPDRMLTLAYRVATGAGYSQTERERLCRQATELPAVAQALASAPGLGEWRNPARALRSQVVTFLRADLGRRADDERLTTVLRGAVLLDELALLPPRQRFALWATTLASCTADDLEIRTGWTPRQIAHLVRAALRTVTTHARL